MLGFVWYGRTGLIRKGKERRDRAGLDRICDAWRGMAGAEWNGSANQRIAWYGRKPFGPTRIG